MICAPNSTFVEYKGSRALACRSSSFSVSVRQPGAQRRAPAAPIVVFGPAAAPAPAQRRAQRQEVCVCRAAAAAGLTRTSEPHLQLATAKLPGASDPAQFAESMYQWAATLTQSGANLPFVHPLRADRLSTGFQISILRRSDKTKGFGSAGDIVATVESAEGVGNVFIVRFFEGEVAQDNRPAGSQPPADPTERLEVVLASLKDVTTIMGTMPQAIRKAAIVSS